MRIEQGDLQMPESRTQTEPTIVREPTPRDGRLQAELSRWSRRLAAPAICAPSIIASAGHPAAAIDFHHLFIHRALETESDHHRSQGA